MEKKLNELIKDKQELVEVYHLLRVLLTEIDKGKFHVLLQQFVSLMKVKHPSFFTYFSNTYVRRASMSIWATCYRVGTIANTNMHLEAFHRKLKVVYLNNKQNWCLDYLLHVLFKIARDIIFETFRKHEMGKVTHRKCEINRRHSKAEELDPDLIQSSGQEWQVKSSTDMSLYCVKLEKKTCDCKLRCEKCNVCVHTYSCTCLDATLHYTMCKHVHLVHMHREQESQSEDQQVNPSKDQQDNNPREDNQSEDQWDQSDNQSEDQWDQLDNQSEDNQSEDQWDQSDM